jgi:hypothetical protein
LYGDIYYGKPRVLKDQIGCEIRRLLVFFQFIGIRLF